MTDKKTMRQDIIEAVFDTLRKETGEARAKELSIKVADDFTRRRRAANQAFTVPQATITAIREDLIKGDLSFGKIAAARRTGMSTVQRVAEELKSQGIKVGRSTRGPSAPTSVAQPAVRERVRCSPSSQSSPEPSSLA